MSNWKKLNREEIQKRVDDALKNNVNYSDHNILGIPASTLDDRVFSRDATFLKDAPFLRALTENPNNIGCHTLGNSEPFFKGTQKIERELLDICGVDILKGAVGEQDGYVASGGTEANIQALWIYRNYFIQKRGADPSEIAILCSEDGHYSMDKGSNILGIDLIKLPVDQKNREIQYEALEALLQGGEKRYLIVVLNMITTMFGSVDNPDPIVALLKQYQCHYKIHVDGAFGGFYYPFVTSKNMLDFSNPEISSFTLDAHKMARAPYGTGIFLIRKGLMQYATTDSASYVSGMDQTLIGSRSGANAIAVWMILNTYGPNEWYEKIFVLQKRTEWLCKQLTDQNKTFYRHPHANIVTIKADGISQKVINQFGLIPDHHHNPLWYKIVIMEHVTIEKLEPLIEALK